jgi:hypothetical protein
MNKNTPPLFFFLIITAYNKCISKEKHPHTWSLMATFTIFSSIYFRMYLQQTKQLQRPCVQRYRNEERHIRSC